MNQQTHTHAHTYRSRGTVVDLSDFIEDNVLDENSDGFQYERHEKMHVDVVPGAVEFPGRHAQHKNTT